MNPTHCIHENQDVINLTPKRSFILGLLAEAAKPLSAYEIVEAYNQSVDKPIHAMSVYRILDYLKSTQLVTHLHSVNKFIAEHHEVSQQEEVSIYATCQQCCDVKKLQLDNATRHSFLLHLHQLGYQVSSHSIEVPGLCERCKEASTLIDKES